MTCDSHAGFVVLLGATNAGKSTLMNKIVGAKVSIVTPKVQTTRSRVRGIVMEGKSQIIFIDTPGIFKSEKRSENRLERAMMRSAWQEAEDVDVRLVIHDCARKQIDDNTYKIIEQLKARRWQASLVLNKIDLTSAAHYMQRTKELSELFDFDKIFMVSAANSMGLSDIVKWLAAQMPEGPYLFDPDDLSDLPLRLLAAEILREKLFLNLHQELPYQMAVETDSWSQNKDGSAVLHLSIYVSRENHKGIVLGRGGQTLRRIGQAARLDLEQFCGHKIHLMTHVKYRKNWMEDKEHYHFWGLDYDA